MEDNKVHISVVDKRSNYIYQYDNDIEYESEVIVNGESICTGCAGLRYSYYLDLCILEVAEEKISLRSSNAALRKAVEYYVRLLNENNNKKQSNKQL